MMKTALPDRLLGNPIKQSTSVSIACQYDRKGQHFLRLHQRQCLKQLL
jgi:hypothetical protein